MSMMAAIALPGIASAQLTDTAYCKALSESYDTYATHMLAE